MTDSIAAAAPYGHLSRDMGLFVPFGDMDELL